MLEGSALAWLAGKAMPFWLQRAWDESHGGYFSRLDSQANAVAEDPKTSLVQARMLFCCAHLAQVAGPGPWHAGIDRAREGMRMLFDPVTGCHVKAVGRDGARTDPHADLRIDAYDQGFVLLGLGALYKVRPAPDLLDEIDRTWQALVETLAEPETGAFHENSDARDASRAYPMPRRQNPHMHLFEALLELFEATGAAKWLEAAERMVELFDRHFVDPETGALREFLDRRLGPAEGAAGEIREPGHQFEWVWLLQRYGRMAGRDMQARIARLYAFGRKGMITDGIHAGLVVDELMPDGSMRTPSMLLWPQTEALKAHLARFEAGDADAAGRARRGMAAMFGHHIRADLPIWRNQIGTDGSTLQPEAPTRLLYHLALAITEAHRCGIDQPEQPTP